MKRIFGCGHTGKGKYCHTCESVARSKRAVRIAQDQKRAARTFAATADPIDLSGVAHLSAVLREAREVLSKVESGIHPFALNGKPIKRSNGQLLSVPVGRSWRLMFEAKSLRPLQLLSHESYNNLVKLHFPA
ncbi:hypothetical protein BZM27_47025 [Paraburkholderia steynii]|uniref:Uncharacterized protein n=1 Tax=Paraburkholderia steynii TaxID=1245441 RepID=A0A4R0X4F6_9BURK|nr:hypothetical protein BZM27_47025 [Paraburkholderia steynii]